MRIAFWSILLLFSSVAYGQKITSQTSGKFLNKMPHSDSTQTKYTYTTFVLENHTFGYEIFANDILLFHQQDMPGKMEGTGFTSKEDATKVAQRIILKLERPVVPPIVTANELQLLGIQ